MQVLVHSLECQDKSQKLYQSLYQFFCLARVYTVDLADFEKLDSQNRHTMQTEVDLWLAIPGHPIFFQAKNVALRVLLTRQHKEIGNLVRLAHHIVKKSDLLVFAGLKR